MNPTHHSARLRLNSLLVLIIGLSISALGIRLILQSDFGISTMSALPVVLNLAFPVLNLGNWNLIIQSLYLLILYLVCRKPVPYYLQSLLLTVYFSFCINLFGPLITQLPVLLPLRVIYFFVGITFLALGIALQMLTPYPILPFDCFVRDLSNHLGASIKLVKTAVDSISVTLSLTISLIFVRRIVGIGIGTIFAVFFLGRLVNGFVRTLPNHLELVRFSFRRELDQR